MWIANPNHTLCQTLSDHHCTDACSPSRIPYAPTSNTAKDAASGFSNSMKILSLLRHVDIKHPVTMGPADYHSSPVGSPPHKLSAMSHYTLCNIEFQALYHYLRRASQGPHWPSQRPPPLGTNPYDS